MWFEDAIGRLKAQVTGMREIDGASSLDAAMRGTVAGPSLYLIPLTEKGHELRSLVLNSGGAGLDHVELVGITRIQ